MLVEPPLSTPVAPGLPGTHGGAKKSSFGSNCRPSTQCEVSPLTAAAAWPPAGAAPPVVVPLPAAAGAPPEVAAPAVVPDGATMLPSAATVLPSASTVPGGAPAAPGTATAPGAPVASASVAS